MLRRKIEALIPEMGEPLVLDCEGVTSAITSFFDELLGRLAQKDLPNVRSWPKASFPDGKGSQVPEFLTPNKRDAQEISIASLYYWPALVGRYLNVQSMVPWQSRL